MKTVKNVKSIALKSYSMWANYLGVLVLLIPEAVYYLWTIDMNPHVAWFVGLGLILLGAAGRIVDQGISKED